MSSAGRPRDARIGDAVLAAARQQLAAHGYDAMSVSAVAEAAGTTRQAVYRRWPSKADLATAAIAAIAADGPNYEHGEPAAIDDPYQALVAELVRFRRGIGRPDGLSMVGTMLQRTTDPEPRPLFRERVVHLRRQRLRSILTAALTAELLPADADIEAALPALTGSFYGRALSDDAALPRWADRTAALVWRGLGGDPPEVVKR